MAKESIHKNHRLRMREKFDEIGFKGWSDYEIMEYMLYNVYSRGDTSPIAHQIMDYGVGNIVNVLKNTYDFEMAKNVGNVGEATVRFLRSLKEFIDYYKRKQLEYEPILLDKCNIANILTYAEFDYEKEDIVMLCADSYLKVKSAANITELTSGASAETSAEKIVRVASTNNASYVVLVHNHPDGNLEISMADIVMTKTVERLLYSIGINLVDHLIVGGKGRYKSIVQYICNAEKSGESLYDDEMLFS